MQIRGVGVLLTQSISVGFNIVMNYVHLPVINSGLFFPGASTSNFLVANTDFIFSEIFSYCNWVNFSDFE